MKVLIIAPYDGLKELIYSIEKKFADMDITVADGNLEAGVQYLLSSETTYDVILSRGETAHMIRKHTSLPVINITISSYDIMRAILLSKSFSGKTALIGFPSITNDAKIVIYAMEDPLEIFTVNRKDDINDLLTDLWKEGYRTIIGDVFASNAAQNHGFNSILLSSGSESLEAALKESRIIYENAKAYTNRIAILTSVLDSVSDILFVINHSREILYQSKGLSPELQNIITDQANLVFKNGNYQFHTDINSVAYDIIGEKVLFSDMESIIFHIWQSPLTNKCTSWLTIDAFQEYQEYPLGILGSVRRYLDSYIPLAQKYSKLDKPFTIIGEKGTGKSHLARMIHIMSHYNMSSFVQIDCELMPENGTEILREYLLKNRASGLPPTLYFKNIDCLNLEQQRLFLENIAFPFQKNCRILVSTTVTPDENSNIAEAVLTFLDFCRIYIKPLNACPELIPELANQFVIEANQTLGKQIISIDTDAMGLLQNHPWKDNLLQLERVIYALVTTAAGPVIQSSDVKKIIQEVPAIISKIDLEQSLDKITDSIIRIVLEEEDGNLSKTAKRLGIGRSTLWRKLNS